ncbi:PhnD/SsuA/transferrin family substrate-binding protein [Rhizobium sp. WL3]|uniref:phosphate/phosphite/phosphonate ABC transporter substrate-binding protein n=1 Tax=Rhizobium sp. WL3 TaxID=2603277 RepID=UPI0011C1F266|nr:PhnD/SsuA/transferrin family substrate-binding protein [Rhizobium sp. WL3]MBX9467414.1 PhnD/SsuA/transferrin family substrate-binding protein [Rhizobium sp.]QEE46972.1 PhnD/SsuA/transferrin family substrate-binding protein [Rhizobium sp. WL3]
MYVAPAVAVEAQRVLWIFLRDHLRQNGFADVPEALDEHMAHHDAWLDPRLLLAQTCGFPFVKRLRGRVRLVATPVYEAPGCEGATMCSVIVVRERQAPSSLAACVGLKAAINETGSNSGYNLLRAAVAPHAGGKPFFSGVVETGGHIASIEAVQAGAADLAAIDCITYDLLRRHAPERLAGLSILDRTPSGPNLPFITRLPAPDEEVAALRDALKAAVTAPQLAEARAILGLKDVVVLEESAYDILLDHEQAAIDAGYPDLP